MKAINNDRLIRATQELIALCEDLDVPMETIFAKVDEIKRIAFDRGHGGASLPHDHPKTPCEVQRGYGPCR